MTAGNVCIKPIKSWYVINLDKFREIRGDMLIDRIKGVDIKVILIF